MKQKWQVLTFERSLDFDGMTDSTILGTKEIISGKCVQYGRSGRHKWWTIVDENGKEHKFNTTFDTLIAVNGQKI